MYRTGIYNLTTFFSVLIHLSSLSHPDARARTQRRVRQCAGPVRVVRLVAAGGSSGTLLVGGAVGAGQLRGNGALCGCGGGSGAPHGGSPPPA